MHPSVWTHRSIAAARAVAAIPIAVVLFSAAELTVRRSADQIRIVAPRMRLLEGRTLERLQNGMAVSFEFQMFVLGEGKRSVLRRSSTRFIMSYDLWEEKFSVNRVTSPRRSVSQLSARDAESWCVDQLSLAATDLTAQRTISLRLEVRAEGAERPERDPETGLSLNDLIEAFSRTGQPPQQKWTFESGPFRVADLKAGSG